MSVSCTELNMDSVSSSKMFVALCQPSRHHIPETGIFIRCIVLMTRIILWLSFGIVSYLITVVKHTGRLCAFHGSWLL
jgi:hypothetical protein